MEEFYLGNNVRFDLKNAWEFGEAKAGLFSGPA
jgi:hypothetical protein